MKAINYMLTVTFTVALATFISCTSNDEETPKNPLEDLTLLIEKEIPNTELTIRVYQYKKDLFVGYNRFEIEVTKAGLKSAFKDAEITFKPLMDMGHMMHACPFENPVVGTNFDDIFAGAVVFVMPSGNMGNWSLGLRVKDNETQEEGEVMFPVSIVLPDDSRMKSFSMGDDKYFVSYVEPFLPQVGINDFEVTIHKKQSMMDWPHIGNFNIEIDPEMPDMGHGSPNNVNPVHDKIGHYIGKVNFTMDGYWKINMELENGGQTQELSFDVTFEHKSNK